MTFGQFDTTTWDNKTNTFTPTKAMYRNSDASTLLDNALNAGGIW